MIEEPFAPLPRDFYARPVEKVSIDLLGRYIVRYVDRQRLVLRIVETEAYLGVEDRASHAWAGRRTERTASLYQPPGHAYVYFIYGMHYCLNAVIGNGVGAAVLIRAGAPVEGHETLRLNRRCQTPPRPGDLAGGPGKLCQALAIDRQLDRHSLDTEPLLMTQGEPVGESEVARGPRIGVAYAGEAASWPLRFALRGHPEVSRPRL